MPRYEITSPDGKRWEVEAPEGATQEQVLSYAQKQWSPKPDPQMSMAKPAAVLAGEAIKDGIPRQLGLTARYGAEALGNASEIITEPIRYLMEKAGMPKMQPTGQAVSGALDRLGLPTPQGANERVIGDATRLGFGAIGGAASLGRLAQGATGATKEVLQQLAARPGVSAISAAGAGGAGGSVREAGGGPGAQFAASLAGGIAAPSAALGLQNLGKQAATAIKSMKADPIQLDAMLKVELQRAGVNWDDIGASVKAQLRNDAKKALVSDQKLDPAALRRLADYRNIGATPLIGDITQDPVLLTQQRNLTKRLANTAGSDALNLPGIDNANARRVLQTLEGASSSADDAFTTGQRIIGGVTGRDAAMQAQEKALYGAARDAAGRDIPLDRGAFLSEAFSNLAQSNKMAFLPEPISKVLNQLGTGKVKVNGQNFDVPFDVNSIDQLKTMLATASRGTQDGNAKAAIKAVRDALENVQPRMPAVGGQQIATQAQLQGIRAGDTAAGALDAFDTARGFARNRRQWQESAKFIEDALGGANPDAFVKKHVIGADVAELSKLKKTFADSPEVLESVKKQLAQHILERGRADSDTVKFTSAGMNDALKAIGDRKLSLFFSPQEVQQLKSAVNVGRYMQSQPIGSAVNNSNTAGALLGPFSSFLDRLSPLPGVGPLAVQPIQGGLLQLQARGMNNLSKGLLNQPQAIQPPMRNALMLPGLLAAPTIQE